MSWKTIAQVSMWTLALFIATPIVLGVRWLCVQVYRAWRTWKVDKAKLDALRVLAMARAKQEQLVRLQPDAHGFGGVVYDQEARAYRDLDTGETFALRPLAAPDDRRLAGNLKQRMLAALTGTTVVQRLAQEIVGEEEKPTIKISDNEWLQVESGNAGGEIEV